MQSSEVPIFIVSMGCFFVFCLNLILKPDWMLKWYTATLKWFSIDMKYNEETKKIFRVIGVGVLFLGILGAYLSFQ